MPRITSLDVVLSLELATPGVNYTWRGYVHLQPPHVFLSHNLAAPQIELTI